MATALLSHPECLAHVTPSGHAEQVARLHHVLAALEGLALDRFDAPRATDDQLQLCHPASYVARIRAAEPATGSTQLDADTHMSPGSFNAALRGAGGAIAATDMVLDGRACNAFVACRPPGHHAERETAMGFCLFGSVAIAAKHALEVRGLERVAIFDPDVHHGNGTQDLVQDDPRILFISTHQMPLYPDTGHPSETGPHGTVLNLPLQPGTDSATYRALYRDQVRPRIADFAPQLILVSAGFDAHRDDPLAACALETEDYNWLAADLCALAGEVCEGRLVACLEGGYDLEALAASSAAFVAAMVEAGA